MPNFPTSWWQKLCQRFRWNRGHTSEVTFWDRYLGTRGLRWPEEFTRRLNPDLELDRELGLLASKRDPGSAITLLDVGAGPLTAVGKRWDGKAVDVKAIDPLALEYDKLLLKHAINPPIRTSMGMAEDVTTLFSENTFDIVHARNCLDHGIDPFRAVSEMLSVAKPGGFVYLKHHPNEAINEEWRGLHQWNFSMNPDGKFIISSRDSEVDVTQALSDRGKVVCELRKESEETWLIVKIEKIAA